MVNTTRGEMDETLLEKREGEFEDENERTTWVEYWTCGEMVHRSVHVTLKKAVVSTTEIGGFNG
jgi:hypothetical protein